METERWMSTAEGSGLVTNRRTATAWTMPRWLRTFELAAGVICALTGCGSPSEPAAAPGGPGAPTRRDTTIVHEPCDIEGSLAVTGDANGDGRPDVVTVNQAGKPVCQWLDLNFDQVGDVWVYYAADGAVRRRETDFDRDGRVDELTTLAGGMVTARQRATTLAGRLDTWQYFEAGVLTRSERDANGDGVIDQWWEYPKTAASACALVHSDTNGDGRPDPGATVDLCANEAAMAEQSSGAQPDAPAFDAPLTESTTEVPPAAAPQQLETPMAPATPSGGAADGAPGKSPNPQGEKP